MWPLPRFTWLLTLLVLFAFAMPVLGAGTGPPGDVVIEQTINPPDPVPVLARETYPWRLSPLENIGSMRINLYESQYPTAMTAQDNYVELDDGASVATVRSTNDTVSAVALRLWRTKGVLAFRHPMSPRILPRA